MLHARSITTLLAAVALPGLLQAQQLASLGAHLPSSAATGRAGPTKALAVRAQRPPVIDGRGDDAVWTTAQVIDDFRTFDPVDNGDPRFRTEARVAYDEHDLYVLIHAYDPHPDSIVSLLSRRDDKTQSDQLKIMIDAYRDGRTGVEFAVNPAGVKRDYQILNDNEEDESWDAVWDVATRIDSLGWVAEFRIPLSQLRYTARDVNTFGFGIWRDVARYNERYAWPAYSRRRPGLVSQFGELDGLTGLASPRRLEVAPYTVAKSYNAPRATTGFAQRGDATMGADIKYGITSNLTLDATVNPDFGQVEADPSVLNLSAFETFFPEKRPFFLEGQGNFRFDLNCSDNVCSGLFYSRRIGRAPELSDVYSDVANPRGSTIIGATKLTGRLANGFSVGMLDAVTRREMTPGRQTIEPQTNYFVGRVSRDFRQGASAVGGMVTSVHRNLDDWSSPYLRRDALVGGLDFRHQFFGRAFEISGNGAFSHVDGSADAIALTQLSSVHDYQRPDDNIVFDSTRTRLDGYTGQVLLSKRGGGMTRGTTGVSVYSPGFEINDVGFLSRANAKNQFFWFQVHDERPRAFYRSWNFNINEWVNETWDGTRNDVGGNVNTHWQMSNSLWIHAGQGINSAVPTYCDNCTRGGPAVRKDPSVWGWAELDGDPRRAIVPMVALQWQRSDGGRSHDLMLMPGFQFRVASRFTGSVTYQADHNIDATQFNGNYGIIDSDTTHYTVARLDQTTSAVTVRASFTATPTLSLQVYAQPFATRGAFSNWLQLADPRAAQWTSRYTTYDGGDPGAFDFKQYRSNTVLRWEYRPGSTIYVVWAQERTRALSGNDARGAPRGLDDLAGAHPMNVFLVKGSYWLSY